MAKRGRPRNTPERIEGRLYWRCAKCGDWYTERHFGRNANRHNGLQGYCRLCVSAHSRKNYLRLTIAKLQKELEGLK